VSAARERILADLRRARDPESPGREQPSVLEARLAGHGRGLIPRRSAGLDRSGLVELFERQAREVSCTVARVARLADLPEALTRYLASQNLPSEVEMAPDALLDSVPWSERPMLKVARGKPSGAEGVGVACGFAGVAETGTLMLASGPSSPATLNFLPDTHVVVLPASRLVGPLEDAWVRLRDAGAGPGAAMPRTVNLITGPSRTADIEQQIEMGAHGPRRLHVIVVEDETVA
jgi:L-lactate dehydrogenase complex protein LldG